MAGGPAADDPVAGGPAADDPVAGGSVGDGPVRQEAGSDDPTASHRGSSPLTPTPPARRRPGTVALAAVAAGALVLAGLSAARVLDGGTARTSPASQQTPAGQDPGPAGRDGSAAQGLPGVANDDGAIGDADDGDDPAGGQDGGEDVGQGDGQGDGQGAGTPPPPAISSARPVPTP
jgi:hypothetical protein